MDSAAREAPGNEDLIGDSVRWGIEAYYALPMRVSMRCELMRTIKNLEVSQWISSRG